jgi:hypothetical protein
MANFVDLRFPYHGLHERVGAFCEIGAGKKENTQPKSPDTGFRLIRILKKESPSR